MDTLIDIASIYDKPINFLIGSGASHGLLPTLALAMKDEFGENYTIESLAHELDETERNALFFHYYTSCIRPAQIFDPSTYRIGATPERKVLDNYGIFLRTVLHILGKRSPRDPRCNIFTTNYDGLFQHAAESIMREGRIEFVLNDGAVGFKRRIFQPRSYNSYASRTGIFERSVSTIPQINLIHLHGSVYWSKDADEVVVDYNAIPSDLGTEDLRTGLIDFSNSLFDKDKNPADLALGKNLSEPLKAFMTQYDKLPIVNPRKWKFHETVFEEHYYHMLRMLSYELEKPNAVLVVFGFSFADEHILSLVKRSLANTSLKVFVCCFNAKFAEEMSKKFAAFENVEIVKDDTPIDFTRFNSHVFRIPESKMAVNAAPAEGTSQ